MYAEMFIVETLRNDVGVQAVLGGSENPNSTKVPVGTRILPYKHFNMKMPAITYESMGGYCDPDLPVQRVMVKVKCWDDTYKTAKELSKAVKEALHKQGGTIGTNCNYIWKVLCEYPDQDEFNKEANKYTTWRVFEVIVQE